MKNNLIFLLLLALPVAGVWGQTVALEEAYINKCISEKKWEQLEALDRSRIWRQVKEDYPSIPYDTATKEISVEHIITFAGVTKEQAFKRVKEWGALNFGSLDAVLEYEDLESGKIILEGWVPILYEATFENMWGNTKSVPSQKKLFFSLVVTLKDGKAKVRYENLTYHYTVGGYTAGTIYIPVEVVKIPLGGAFPLTAGAPGTWKGSVDLLKKTMKELNATAPDMETYIRNIVKDYDF